MGRRGLLSLALGGSRSRLCQRTPRPLARCRGCSPCGIAAPKVVGLLAAAGDLPRYRPEASYLLSCPKRLMVSATFRIFRTAFHRPLVTGALPVRRTVAGLSAACSFVTPGLPVMATIIEAALKERASSRTALSPSIAAADAASMMVLVLSEVSRCVFLRYPRHGRLRACFHRVSLNVSMLPVDGAGPAYVPDLEAFELSPSRETTG